MARKILLADDSVTAQNMGRKILADAGYDVLTVNNGSAALKRIAECSPDLIILDVYMPGYSGLEVCQRLKDADETAHIPVLLSVGKLEPFKPQEARRVRADAHIVKPFEASQLLTAIARLEDQMVPQQHRSTHRFATSGSVPSMDDPFGRPEESRILGRGAKLSRKNKEGSQTERTDPSTGGADNQISSQAASFRDFRKRAKSQSAGASPVEYSPDGAAEPVSHDPGPLAKLPGDITAEELSALSEVAAKLHEAPAAQSTSSPDNAVFAVSSETADAQLEAEVARLPVVEAATFTAPALPGEESVSAPLPEADKTEPAASAEPPSAQVEPQGTSATAGELEIPVAQFEAANNGNEAVAEGMAASAQVETEAVQVESPFVEPRNDSQDQQTQMGDAISAASFAQEPAPVDQQDEPMFASAHFVHAYAEEIEQAGNTYVSRSEAPAEQSVEVAPTLAQMEEKKENFASVLPSYAQTTLAESASLEAAALESTTPQFASAESESSGSISAGSVSQSGLEEVQRSEAISSEPVPVAGPAPVAEEAIEPAAPMPSEAELAEALRLLTPATVQSETALLPAETASATRQWADEETMEIAAGKRWVAEALALTPEEAGMSLEAEMFRAFAANAEKIESLSVENPLVAIQMAVETRLAAEAAAAEQFAPAGETTPKAMAATAPAGVTAAPSAETDIASIVEKVMADLRPKIVEEIARKLATRQDQ